MPAEQLRFRLRESENLHLHVESAGNHNEVYLVPRLKHRPIIDNKIDEIAEELVLDGVSPDNARHASEAMHAALNRELLVRLIKDSLIQA